MTKQSVMLFLLLPVLMRGGPASGGSIDSPASPASSNSAMYSVSDVYNRLATGAPGALRTGGFSDPVAAPAPTGHTLNEVMDKAPSLDPTSGAVVGDVITGKTFWGLASNQWGRQTGSIPVRALSPASSAVPAGYYAATNLVQVDTDLVTGNIKAGANIFGVAGKTEVVDTATGDAVAADMLSGKKAWVDGAEVTGNVPAGSNRTGTDGSLVITITDGLYSGSKTATAVDADLVTGNIKAGANIFGVTGKTEVVDTTTGDATGFDLMVGKKAWVDGAEVTGTILPQALSPADTAVPAGYYAATNLVQVDTNLVSGNIKAGVDIFGIIGKTEVVDTTTGDAGASDMLAGKKAWVDGVEVTGSMPSQSLSAASTSVPAGYYASNSLNQVDLDLASNNIRGGITIFGIAGTRYAPVAETGQRTSYGTRDDGALQPGVAWPSPRFVRGSSGVATNTVLDSLTGLTWSWDAQPMGLGATTNWNGALSFCNSLNSIAYGGRTDWRLPTRFELESLLDFSQTAAPIVVSPASFTNTVSALCWSSTTDGILTTRAWTVNWGTGQIDRQAKTSTYMVWPVAGGE